MLAVARAADGGEVPAYLAVAWQCQQWKALPEAGGIFDQDTETLLYMSYALNVYETIQASRSAPSLAEWAQSNPDGARLISEIHRMSNPNG